MGESRWQKWPIAGSWWIGNKAIVWLWIQMNDEGMSPRCNICSTLIHLSSTFSLFVWAPLLSSFVFLLFSSPLSLLQYMICDMHLTFTHDTNAIILLEPFLLLFIFKNHAAQNQTLCFQDVLSKQNKNCFKQSQWFLYFSSIHMFFSHWKPLVQPPPPSLEMH